MSTALIILLIVAGLSAACFLLMMVVGRSTPPLESGRAHLIVKLVEYGVARHNYSDNFLYSLAEQAVVVARGYEATKLKSFPQALVDYLESMASTIAQYDRGELSEGMAKGALYESLKREHPVLQKFEIQSRN